MKTETILSLLSDILLSILGGVAALLEGESVLVDLVAPPFVTQQPPLVLQFGQQVGQHFLQRVLAQVVLLDVGHHLRVPYLLLLALHERQDLSFQFA